MRTRARSSIEAWVTRLWAGHQPSMVFVYESQCYGAPALLLTEHQPRARSTVATQLCIAKKPMTLFE